MGRSIIDESEEIAKRGDRRVPKQSPLSATLRRPKSDRIESTTLPKPSIKQAPTQRDAGSHGRVVFVQGSLVLAYGLPFAGSNAAQQAATSAAGRFVGQAIKNRGGPVGVMKTEDAAQIHEDSRPRYGKHLFTLSCGYSSQL